MAVHHEHKSTADEHHHRAPMITEAISIMDLAQQRQCSEGFPKSPATLIQKSARELAGGSCQPSPAQTVIGCRVIPLIQGPAMAPALRQDARGCSPGLLQAKRCLPHGHAAHLRNPLLRSINRQQRSTFSQPGPCARRALCIRSAAAADASDAGEPRCMRSTCEMTAGSRIS